MTNTYDKTIRKWSHKFNEMGIEGLFTKIDYAHTVKIENDARKEIVKIASTNPRNLRLKFSTWSMRSLAGYLSKEEDKKIVKQGTTTANGTVEQLRTQFNKDNDTFSL